MIREFYADRDYDRSGSIVFTRRVGRLDPQQVADKVLRACIDGKVRTIDGDDIDIDFDSVCIHSDTPGALELVRERATRWSAKASGPPARNRSPLITEPDSRRRKMALHDIVSPLPGTFYRRPSPEADYYVAVNATVAAGAVVGLVEVMKQFTEIEADAAGRVVELLVDDGEPVDAGQVLMRIEG